MRVEVVNDGPVTVVVDVSLECFPVSFLESRTTMPQE
jgi:hypothetical protein